MCDNINEYYNDKALKDYRKGIENIFLYFDTEPVLNNMFVNTLDGKTCELFYSIKERKSIGLELIKCEDIYNGVLLKNFNIGLTEHLNRM